MNSRVHPNHKTKYRVTNWAEYELALIQRDASVLQCSVENAFFRYKQIVGDRLRARHSDAQKTEAVIACNVLNRML